MTVALDVTVVYVTVVLVTVLWTSILTVTVGSTVVVAVEVRVAVLEVELVEELSPQPPALPALWLKTPPTRFPKPPPWPPPPRL